MSSNESVSDLLAILLVALSRHVCTHPGLLCAALIVRGLVDLFLAIRTVLAVLTVVSK